MNQIIEMTVDIQDGITHSYKEFSQNNLNNSELILNIADGGKEFLLEEKDKIIVYFKKPDKQFVFQDKDIVVLDKTKGKIKVLLTAQTIVVPGTVYGEISIERVEGGVKKRTSTYSFSFRVRSSLASNEVIESTNEFGPLQKGIEVGEKFKDVDLDPIIVAGELAKGALPKTGGNMTGTLNMTNSTVNWEHMFTNNGGRRTRMFMDNGNGTAFTIVTEKTAGKGDWDFNEHLRVGDRRNWMKNSGDTMTGALTMQNDILFDGSRQIASKTATGQLVFGNSGVWLGDSNGGLIPWNYRYSDKKLIFNADMQIDKPVIVAGNTTFNGVTNLRNNVEHVLQGNTDKGVSIVNNDSQSKWSIGPKMTGTVDWSKELSLNLNTGLVTVAGLATKKDGMVSLTLTADATNANAGYMPIADRRGNTVTVRMEVTRNAGSTNPLICTLPVDLRPANTISMNFIANDGTVVGVNIMWDGKVEMYKTGTQTKVVATYVVN
ncbi:hypothetical protein BK702_22510 [Bacillus thuringiensis serovar cameroun]|nr:hypothetical protein BK702_22510 [Bacillus thuringiensis serovar cameroun]